MPSFKPLLYVFLGGGLGASARYLITLFFTRNEPAFYWATLLSNVLGCLILGVLVGLREKSGLSSTFYLLFAVGFCGALTTFSTWIFEQQQLLAFRGVTIAALYIMVSWIAGWMVFVSGGYLARTFF